LIELSRVLAETRQHLAAVSESADLDAQVLLAHVLAKPRSWILAHPDALLDEYQLERYETLTRRLESGEPLPHIIGHWEFYGLDFTLSPAVLIPRPETEMLVEHALHWLVEHPARRSILDVGTGSGCIAVSLALNCPDARILASDISLEALQVARQNVLRHAVSDRVQLLQCDLLPPTSLPFDLLCANLPYIPAANMPQLSVAAHEPLLALDGGVEGVIWISRFLERAPFALASGGFILLEIEASQGSLVTGLAQTAFPQARVQLLPDLAGRDRLVTIQIL